METVGPFRGSCLCGGVTYEVSPPFLFFQHCHCSRCRKSSGTAFGSRVMAKTAHFRWMSGEELVRRWEMPTAEHYCTGFCDVCGSQLPWLSRNGKYVFVPAGTLDDDPGERPTRNVNWASRARWYVHPHELETFEEGP